MAQMSDQLILPRLREDLQLVEGDQDPITFETSWMIYDGLQHRYFKISHRIVQILGAWRPGVEGDEFRDQMTGDLRDLTDRELREIVSFLANQNLIQLDSEIASSYLIKQHQSKQKSWISRVIHNYLFFRFPLFRPQRFLQSTAWIPDLLMAPIIVWGIWLFGLFGLGSVATSFDQFWSTFSLMASWEGAALYGFCLIVVKSLHELGHAYAAIRYGVRVSSMGIAFLVLFPVLYTDVTDAWRLSDRYQRFKIAIAGIATEFHVGLIACGVWALTDSDLVRSLAFVFATTSLIASVIINISPFLRFDGYFAMSDLLRVENLQSRAFAIARWRLRRLIFGFDEAPPEQFEPTLRRVLTLYALGTWVYRFFLFLGIAILVYQLAFKVLGIVLFVIEIMYFILLPIFREILHVVRHAKMLRLTASSAVSLLSLLLLVAVIVSPQANRVRVFAVMTDADYRPLFAPESAELSEVLVEAGDWVSEGQLVARFVNRDLLYEKERVKILLNRFELELKNASLADTGQEGQRVFNRQIERYRETIKSLDERIDDLDVRANISGEIRGSAEPLIGQVVEKGSLLFEVVPAQQSVVVGYVPTNVMAGLSAGQQALLVRENNGFDQRLMELLAVDQVATTNVEYRELLSSWGGNLIDMNQTNDRATTERLHYPHHRIILRPIESEKSPPVVRESVVVIFRQNELSYAQLWWRTIQATLIREIQF